MTAGDMYNGDETNFGSDGGMKLCQASASRLTSRARSNVLYLHVCVKCKNETASYGKIQKIQGAPLSFLQVEYSSRFKSLNPNLNLPGPSLRLSPSYGVCDTSYQDADCLLFLAKSDSWSYSLVQGRH